MGRSVSTPSGATVTVFTTVEIDSTVDEFIARENWDWAVESLTDNLQQQYPSLYDCDKWLGREDHAILANDLAYVTVSEYCGLVAVCLVPRDDDYNYSDRTEGLSEQWCRRVEAGFRKCVAGAFGPELQMVGRASNGEAFFQEVK